MNIYSVSGTVIFLFNCKNNWSTPFTVETVSDFIFLGSKITADGDCSHEIKKTLTPWKESYHQPR